MGVKAARRAAGRVRAAGASGAGAAGGAAVLAIRQVDQRGPHKLQWELQRGGETAGGARAVASRHRACHAASPGHGLLCRSGSGPTGRYTSSCHYILYQNSAVRRRAG